jgi:hypothetical protein
MSTGSTVDSQEKVRPNLEPLAVITWVSYVSNNPKIWIRFLKSALPFGSAANKVNC